MANIFDFLSTQLQNPDITTPSQLASTPVSLIGFQMGSGGNAVPITVSSDMMISVQQAAQGPQGTRGASVQGSQGVQGAQGPGGIRGPQGYSGTQGTSGKNGTDFTQADIPTLITSLRNAFSATDPIGMVIMSTDPDLQSKSILPGSNLSAWLKCDGSSISATDYHDLATAIGTKYGGTAANPLLPDFNGRIPCGSFDPSNPYVGQAGNTIQLTSNEIPSHSHQIKFAKANIFKAGTAAMAMPASGSGIGLYSTPKDAGMPQYQGYDQQVYTQTAGNSGSIFLDITPACTKVVFYIKAL